MSTNPFPGAQPYRAADRGRFYGRDALIKKLANQILARSATTVFGPSGAGKSSLMQAGVIPALEDSDDIRLVRVDAWPAGETPLPWLVNAIAGDLELGVQSAAHSPLEMLRETIDLAGRQSDRPMLIYLDQFEQIFNAGHEESVLKDLLDGLSWLIRRKQNRELHLILSLREDYLGRLRNWTREKPELTAHGFRVGPLTVGEMVKAMCRTAADGDPPQTWHPEEIRGLMLDVREPGQSAVDGAEVQAAFAQIVCRALWEERAAGKTIDMRTTNAEVILHRYLDATLAGLGRLQESALKLLEQHLIDEEGHRTLLTEKESRLVLPPAEATELLTQLEKAAILHGREHHGSRYFELGHDWLAKKVYERRIERKAREAEAEKLAQERAARERFRRILLFSGAAWIILGSLVAWALVERGAARREKNNAELQTEEARKQRDAAIVAEKKAQQASRMAITRDLMLGEKPDLAAMVLTTVDEPHEARGWMQAAIDALKVRLPQSTLQFGAGDKPYQWSHDGKRLLVFTADQGASIVDGERKTKPITLDVRARAYARAEWSPDDRYLAIETQDGSLAITRSDGSGKRIELPLPTASLNHLAWSSDGKRIAAALSDHTARIWNADGSGTPKTIEHGNQVMFVAWNPDGTRLTTTTIDRKAIVWNGDGSGSPTVALTDLASIQTAFSPDGKRLAGAVDEPRDIARPIMTQVVQASCRLAIWNDTDNRLESVIPLMNGTVRSIQWHPRGDRLVLAFAKSARIVNLDKQAQTIIFDGHREIVTSAQWSPDAEYIATVSTDKSIRIWTANDTAHELVLGGNTDSSTPSFAWTPDGKRIVSVNGDAKARSWNVSGAKQPVILHQRDWILSSAWSVDGQRIVLTDESGVGRIWNADGSGERIDLDTHAERVKAAAWSPDGRRLAILSAKWSKETREARPNPRRINPRERPIPVVVDEVEIEEPMSEGSNSLRIRNADGAGKPLEFPESPHQLVAMAWRPDGNAIATLTNTGTVEIWDAVKPTTPLMFDIPDFDSIQAVPRAGKIRLTSAESTSAVPLWSPDGKNIATISRNGVVRIWNTDRLADPIVLEGNIAAVSSGAWSPDGKRFAIAAHDNAVRIWNIDAPANPMAPHTHAAFVPHIAWNPDGTRMASVSSDGTVHIWPTSGKDKPLVLKGHEAGPIVMVQWSPDGKRLVTASEDETARVWNADGSGAPIVLAGHHNVLTRALWSPDGKRILTVSADRTARVWLVDIPLLQEALRNATTSCLTPAERESFLVESESAARQGYEQCEKAQGRTPSP